MGHNRLGRLPQTRRWHEVVSLLTDSPEEVDRIGAAIVSAADGRFLRLANEATLSYPIWLISRLTYAARRGNFLAELRRLGMAGSADSSAVDVIAVIGDRVRTELSANPSIGHLSELAIQALRSSLTTTVGLQGKSLFDSNAQDVQRAFRTFSTEARFGELARRFFSDFMSRALRSYVDRELRNRVGGGGIASAADATSFLQALDLHAWETSRILERFAGEWHSKHNWQARGDLTRAEAQRFTAQGMRKLRSELKRRDRSL